MSQCLPSSVTWPSDGTFVQYLASIYGFTPIMFILVLAVLFFKQKLGTRELWWMMYLGISTAVSEGIKPIAKDPRPTGSSCSGYGMPSSHSALSVGWLTLLALDMSVGVMSKSYDLRLYVAALILLLPVPISRTINNDHSTVQVFAGSFLGLLLGACWFGLSIPIRKRYASLNDLAEIATLEEKVPISPSAADRTIQV